VSGPIHLAIVIGTRPEAIKLAPVILAAGKRGAEFRVRVVLTGQHRELVDQVLAEFDIAAHHDLNVMRTNQDLAHVMAESVRGLSSLFAEHRPDWVLVQGDTTTTLAGALAGFYNRTHVGHVEAGLRTGNRHSPFPEEANRALTSRLADLHFAPTPSARQNLLQEGLAADDILVTGNTVVDALRWTLAAHAGGAVAPVRHERPYVLVTAHRRENHGPALHRICDALLRLLHAHPHLDIRVPMHPSPVVRDVLVARLGADPRVRLIEPMGYAAFVCAMAGAALVLTDSGGVQEECAALGRPVLVMRTDTERMEAVEAGVALLVGTQTESIVGAASALLSDASAYDTMARASNVFGEGTASTQILNAIAARSAPQGNHRPD
jgi:UDP-N-acetylglucosamine 2-epimerase (non-hydrolysing)